MNRSIVSFVFLIVPVVLCGCSFSKEKVTPQVPIVPAQVSQEANVRQIQLIAAIKLLDPELIEAEVKRFAPEDFMFAGLKETPASISLNYDSPEILKLLAKLKVDIVSLGDREKDFSRKHFAFKIHTIFSSHRYPDTVGLNEVLSDSELALVSLYQPTIDNIFSTVIGGQLERAKGLAFASGIHCEIISGQILLLAQEKFEKESFDKVEQFLNGLPCRLNSEKIQAAYLLELNRQFKVLFTSPTVLKYLGSHPSFVDAMWNVGNSGIWISPQLLLRIAYSPENITIGEYRGPDCSEAVPVNDRNKLCFYWSLESGAFMRSLGLNTRWEFIDARAGMPKYSLKYFPRDVSTAEDVFFKKVATFIKISAQESEAGWEVGNQIRK